MDKLVPAIRNYSWGSRTMIPALLGQETLNVPVAELWYGAHPAAPSQVAGSDCTLADVIVQDPACVGAWSKTGLPFLMKLLAADEVLSLQAHPSPEQAAEGFARENALGIPLDDPKRNYKDASYKPEIIIALTPFYAMAGFRPLRRTRELFAALQCPELERYSAMLSLDEDVDAESANLRALFTTWITIPSATRHALIDAIVAAAPNVAGRSEGKDSWMSRVMDTVVAISKQYPGDIGVLGALLLNHIELAPGEACFLAAGQLHAYVHGLGVEVMANSDNVLRGGLTPKNVDVPELVKVLRFESLEDPRVTPVQAGSAWEYRTLVPEFNVYRFDLSAGDCGELPCGRRGVEGGPGIALCTAGRVRVGDQDLRPGEAVFLPADAAPATYCAAGIAQLFVASA